VVSIAMLPAAASAVTLDTTNNIGDGGNYDIFGGPYFFGASFDGTDGAGVFAFNFFNGSATDKTVGVTIGTVLQTAFSAVFTSGVTAEWLNGGSAFIPQGVTSTFEITTLLAPGTADTLKVTYGDVVGGGRADIDLVIAAVPLPAGGLLLIGALGGLAALRRRKKAA
jgi:hypothetical protein